MGFKRVTALALQVGQGFGGEADFSGFIFLSPGIFPTESCIAASFRGGAGKSRHDGVPARRGKGEAIWLFIPVRSERRCSVFWEGGEEKKRAPPTPGRGKRGPVPGWGLHVGSVPAAPTLRHWEEGNGRGWLWLSRQTGRKTRGEYRPRPRSCFPVRSPNAGCRPCSGSPVSASGVAIG